MEDDAMDVTTVDGGSSSGGSSSPSLPRHHARHDSLLSASSGGSLTTAFSSMSGATALSGSRPSQPPLARSTSGGSSGSASGSNSSRMMSPPGTPTRTHKLRAEYHARLSSPSPVKRRMSLEPQSPGSASPRSTTSSKRSNSPLVARRNLSEGMAYGDRFIPARWGAQMDITYSLMDDGDDDSTCSALAAFPSEPVGILAPLRTSSSSLSFLSMGLVSSAASVASVSSSLIASMASVGQTAAAPAAVVGGVSGTTSSAVTAPPATAASGHNSGAPTGAGEVNRESQSVLNMLLKSELLGVDYLRSAGGASAAATRSLGPDSKVEAYPRAAGGSSGSSSGASDTGATGCGSRSPHVGTPTKSTPSLLNFKSPREKQVEDMRKCFSILPVGAASRRLLATPRKAKRKISKVPFKVLDAPALQDDFYLNLVDWSSLNVLAVGLGACVYLWSACTSKVTKLCDLGQDDCVTSVAWTQRGTHLAVGTNQGEVQIWEASRCKKVRTMPGHSARIGTMSWNAQVLASGSRDRLILLRDVRAKEPYTGRLQAHRQEVCGLRWSFDDNQLASGGNDNKLYIWNLHASSPVQKFTEHTAAVKAIAWSPHQSGLLASGGGTADRCIRFWNTLTGAPLSCVDTGSQVCNLMWSKNINEIVSTHGYSLNQIIVWRYPSMAKVATLTGHTYRVLYLAMSPDGQTIVTGAGDETLRFWNAFPGAKSNDGSRLGTDLLFPMGNNIR